MPSGPEPRRRAFCLQHHTGAPRGDHHDLMIEDGGALATWACSRPLGAAGDEQEALRLGDHRLAYLDYAGPVAGERGQVCPVWRGQAEVLVWSAEEVMLRLEGGGRSGCVRLLAEAGGRWRLTWRPAAGSGSGPS